MKRFALFLVLSSFIAGETYSMSCRGTCKIKVPAGSYEEDVYVDITKPKTWDEKVTVKVAAHDEVRAVTMPSVPDDVKSLAAARPHMDNFCASHFNNYTGMSSVVSCEFPLTAEEIKAQKKAQKEWEQAEAKQKKEDDKIRQQWEIDQKKIKDIEIAAEKKDAAEFKKMINSLASSVKCADGEVSISSNKPQEVKLADSTKVQAYQGCAKKVGKDLVLSNGVVRMKDRTIYSQVSKGAMNGKALGSSGAAGTKLNLVNNKIVSGVYSKTKFTVDANYRGDKKEIVEYNGDKATKKTYLFAGQDGNGSLFLAMSEEFHKGKKISQKNFSEEGKIEEELQFNGKGELFASTNHSGAVTNFACISKPNYKDKKNMIKHCVDEDYWSPISKVFTKLEEKYPEMKKVQNRLNTTFKVRYNSNEKCIVKSASNKVVVKFNPDKEYIESQFNYTVDKTYAFSDQDDDEIYTIITSGKDLRETCASIASEPRSKSMGQYGKLKKAVYCKEAPKEDEVIAD